MPSPFLGIEKRPKKRLSKGAELAAVRALFESESRAIAGLAKHLGPSVLAAADVLALAKGRIIATGIGKSGLVAQKFSATLASTGSPSFFIHAAEAVHGDLGRIVRGDVVLAVSNSGETAELLALIRPLRRAGVPLVVLCGESDSPLADAADAVVAVGPMEESGPTGLVPTSSIAALLAAGDALAMTLAARRGFTAEAYARIHPGGKLGRSSRTVRELLRAGDALPLVTEHVKLASVVVAMTNTPGRPGAAIVVDGRRRLKGVFTDGDLRRLAQRGELDLDIEVSKVMTRKPLCIGPSALIRDAEEQMHAAMVDQLPVVDSQGRVVGLLDVQDLLVAHEGTLASVSWNRQRAARAAPGPQRYPRARRASRRGTR